MMDAQPNRSFPVSGTQGGPDGGREEAGFSLIETMIGMFILTMGLLSTGQLIYVAMTSSSLARSKGSAAIVAQNKMEFLADLYRQNAIHADLTVGTHGPEQTTMYSPADGTTVMNRYNVSWTVSTVVTNGKTLKALQVTVTVTPIRDTGTTTNMKSGMNKVVSLTGLFSARVA